MKLQTEDQFLLLSLYLDDEVSPAERSQVELWLNADEQFRACYAQQLLLRQQLRQLPTPAPKVSEEALIKRVLAEVGQRSHQKRQVMLGVGALCAGMIAVIGALLSLTNGDRAPQFSSAVHKVLPKQEPLMIAMERPIVPLPKALKQP